MRDEPILKVDGLSRYFPVRNAFGMKIGSVRALDGVSFDVRAGETLGIVGEFGLWQVDTRQGAGRHPCAERRRHRVRR